MATDFYYFSSSLFLFLFLSLPSSAPHHQAEAVVLTLAEFPVYGVKLYAYPQFSWAGLQSGSGPKVSGSNRAPNNN